MYVWYIQRFKQSIVLNIETRLRERKKGAVFGSFSFETLHDADNGKYFFVCEKRFTYVQNRWDLIMIVQSTGLYFPIK